MGLKSGGTSFSMQQVVARRHQQRVGVGETYEDRQKYQMMKSRAESPRPGFFSKIKDFFLGPKLPNVHEFAPNANYVNGASITEYQKMVEQGIKPGTSTDEDLFAILNAVKKSFDSK